MLGTLAVKERVFFDLEVERAVFLGIGIFEELVYVLWAQCDQMAILIFSYLPNCNNENMSKSIKEFQRRFNILPHVKYTLKQLPKTLNILTLWQKFAKSGHTVWAQLLARTFKLGSFGQYINITL